MIKKKLIINNKLGLHARPAALIVQITNKHASEVYISKGDSRINAKSIMGVLTLAAAQGSELTIEADGPDETALLDLLEELIRNGFGEE